MSNLVESRPVSTPRGSVTIKCEVPSTCPHCHEKMTPYIVHQEAKSSESDGFAVLYRCTYPDCREFFAIYLVVNETLSSSNRTEYSAKIKTYTYSPKPIYDMPVEIDDISESFRKIYAQSQLAEALGLTEISGVGYRKSIEFLVKDYLKSENIKTNKGKDPDGITLSQAISLIPVDRIKRLALAAAWLGNDEAHYVRDFDEHDIEDMKGFIRSLGHEVSSIVLSNKASSLISSKGSSSPIS